MLPLGRGGGAHAGGGGADTADRARCGIGSARSYGGGIGSGREIACRVDRFDPVRIGSMEYKAVGIAIAGAGGRGNLNVISEDAVAGDADVVGGGRPGKVDLSAIEVSGGEVAGGRGRSGIDGSGG